MRKIILFLSLSLLTLISNAQFKKGTFSPHFDIGNLKTLNISNNNSEKIRNIGFDPGVGYFIKNNWEVGAELNYTKYHYIDKTGLIGAGSENSYAIGAKLYTNYYFGKGRLKPYVTFQTGFLHYGGYYVTGGSRYNFDQNAFYMAAGGGMNWNVSKRVSIFAEGTYQNREMFNKYNANEFVLTVGLRFYLFKKK